MSKQQKSNKKDQAKKIFINTLTPNFSYKDKQGQIRTPEKFPIKF